MTLDTLINRLPDQVYVKDTASRFVGVNLETAHFMGASSPDEIVGKTDFDFFPPELASQFRAEEEALLQRNQPCVNRETAVTDSTGQTRWILTTKVPLCDSRGIITGLLGINRDITDVKQAHETLLRINAELEQRVAERTRGLQAANEALQGEVAGRRRTEEELLNAVTRLEEQGRAKSAFVFNVSHELKTPLASMTYGIYNLLKGVTGPLPERTVEYLKMLEGDCRRMSRTVADILDLGRLEASTMRLNKIPIPFARLVKRAAESLSTQAQNKHITATLDTSRGQGFVNGDAFKMERVIVNIIDNAIKFTPEGGTIDITVHSGSPS
jgi:PAS domain S-box-containing protein